MPIILTYPVKQMKQRLFPVGITGDRIQIVDAHQVKLFPSLQQRRRQAGRVP